ncbi:glycosyltransferase family 1 protein [Microbulbifer thermotolerans]|uniref:glycosyltransferase family 4 protein n=1 Tax=Microbulbifer thermotolerans TaxID=252514 RepID=UPI00224B46D2|nr:glycosyltransferase family 1 protein [Microbulbifer thermotolerans]MCX2833511.1 glycosyltransferase family 4 protein [Microbulbifer thermotolerans]WKT59074.1 glycosyltransferase family 1 protein [Microbulbifer thermotolerans]
MARIAVDARPLSIPTTGIGRYTCAILERMVNSRHQWYLYSHQPLLKDFKGHSNVTVRCGNVQKSSIGSLFAQAFFPLWASKDKVDIFWSPRHHLPLCLGKSVFKALTIHDLVWHKFPETMPYLGRLLERMLMPPSLKAADAVIAVSDSTAQELQQAFSGCAGKIETVVEAPFLELVDKPSPLGDYFLFVGTLEPRKNLIRLLDAYALYQARASQPLPLRICGAKGWGLPELEKVISHLGLKEWVQILGYVADDQLPQLYGGARALLIPSLYEGFGLPIVEAYSQGTPVMTSNRGAMAEVAGEAALLVDPENEVSMAQALSVLTQDEEKVKCLQSRALKRARYFSWDSAAAKTLSVLESCLSHQRLRA